jgi:uncharacterized LabA/DUF88 family protein
MSDRVMLFIDYQNTFSGARRSFYAPSTARGTAGQFDPMKLGRIVVDRSPLDRTLEGVRVYRGRPDSTRDPMSYGANLRQCAAWEKAGTTVIWRALRYPNNWPTERAEEKGIDVALAIDFVTMAVRGLYDVGILVSTDTDLKPALEAVTQLALFGPAPKAEVAAWSAPTGHSRRLGIGGRNLWCHWLDEADYNGLRDTVDYNIAP